MPLFSKLFPYSPTLLPDRRISLLSETNMSYTHIGIKSLLLVFNLYDRHGVPVLLTTPQAEETHVMKSHKWSACVHLWTGLD